MMQDDTNTNFGYVLQPNALIKKIIMRDRFEVLQWETTDGIFVIPYFSYTSKLKFLTVSDF